MLVSATCLSCLGWFQAHSQRELPSTCSLLKTAAHHCLLDVFLREPSNFRRQFCENVHAHKAIAWEKLLLSLRSNIQRKQCGFGRCMKHQTNGCITWSQSRPFHARKIRQPVEATTISKGVCGLKNTTNSCGLEAGALRSNWVWQVRYAHGASLATIADFWWFLLTHLLQTSISSGMLPTTTQCPCSCRKKRFMVRSQRRNVLGIISLSCSRNTALYSCKRCGTEVWILILETAAPSGPSK